MNINFIDLAQQCCDADDYLDMGYMCAEAGMCYNPLRPIGNTFWFSIPYVFNTSEQIFFYLHIGLLALLAASVFYLWKKILPTCVFLFAVVFLNWPTFFHTLSDTPAALLFIEGIVLALLAEKRNNAVVFFVAGIFFGLSVLLRAAYFYPLLIAGLTFFIYVLWQKNRQWPALFVLSFVIPLSAQFVSTWKHTGQWHFLSEGRSRAMMKLHLNSDAAGYDSYLPQGALFWSPNCTPAAGLLPSLKSADVSSSVCILKNRFHFYLGSFATHTYLGAGDRNFFDNKPAKTISADKSPFEHSVESRSLLPLPAGLYRYQVSVRSDAHPTQQPLQMQADNLTITKTTSTGSVALLKKPLFNKTINNNAPSHTFDISNTDTGYLAVRITSPDSFSVQKATLLPATTIPGFVSTLSELHATLGQRTNFAKHNRIFSSSYLLINLLALAAAMFYLYTLLVKTRSAMAIFIAVLLFTVFVQCLMIIPEQRYIQGLLCACWLLGIALLFNRRKHS